MKFLINPWITKDGVTTVSLLHSYVKIYEERDRYVLGFYSIKGNLLLWFDTIDEAKNFTVDVISENEDVDVIQDEFEKYYNQKRLELK